MKAQRGATLLAMLVVIVLGAAWFTVTAIGNPIDRTAEERTHNAAILQEAKTALIGYVAHHAAMSGEADPGALPCPEAAGNIGTGNEGIAAGNCTLPAVGRLPWRTLGLDKWRDAAGEPLWYIVSPGWGKPNAVTNTVINSSSTGGMTLDGTGDMVAFIIAPGRPLQVSASPSCVARIQRRTTPSPAIDFRDYLDCDNATMPADAVFASSGPAGSFNDQVIALTGGELLPALESAVGARFVRQFGPSMRYCGGIWPACTGAVSLPFAANFGNPALSNFQGAFNVVQGFLPLSFGATSGCQVDTPVAPFCAPPPACATGSDNRCAPTLVAYSNAVFTTTGSGSPDVEIHGANCAVAGTPSTLTCTLNVRYFPLTPAANRWIAFDMHVTTSNIGMALRRINAAVQITGIDTTATGVNLPFGYNVTSATMNPDGSATVRIASRILGTSGGLLSDLLCGLGILGLLYDCDQHTITLPFMWTDEPMLYANDPTMAWWYRNAWHQHIYYAVSAGNAPSGPGTCTAGTTCLSVFGLTPNNTQRAIAIFPGRALGAQVRPPVAIGDWLEGGNANLPPDSAFWARDPALMVKRTFNDRTAVIDSN